MHQKYDEYDAHTQSENDKMIFILKICISMRNNFQNMH